jgi:hypothetical protein
VAVLIAVDPEFKNVVLSDLKAAGKRALSQGVAEKEYQAIWASDSTKISPYDYFRDFEPGSSPQVGYGMGFRFVAHTRLLGLGAVTKRQKRGCSPSSEFVNLCRVFLAGAFQLN